MRISIPDFSLVERWHALSVALVLDIDEDARARPHRGGARGGAPRL